MGATSVYVGTTVSVTSVSVEMLVFFGMTMSTSLLQRALMSVRTSVSATLVFVWMLVIAVLVLNGMSMSVSL